MPTVGLTGSFGTGKTTVAGIFARLGAKIIDADKINHRLMRRTGSCFHKVVRAFGNGILTRGDVDRKKIAAIVFSDPAKLKRLSKIVHPQIITEIKKEILRYRKEKKTQIIIIDAPLLIEVGLQKNVDILIVVTAGRKEQIKRVTRRMKINPSEAIRRIKSQMALREKIRWADMVIDNNGSLTKTKKEVKTIWQRLLQKKQKK